MYGCGFRTRSLPDLLCPINVLDSPYRFCQQSSISPAKNDMNHSFSVGATIKHDPFNQSNHVSQQTKKDSYWMLHESMMCCIQGVQSLPVNMPGEQSGEACKSLAEFFG